MKITKSWNPSKFQQTPLERLHSSHKLFTNLPHRLLISFLISLDLLHLSRLEKFRLTHKFSKFSLHWLFQCCAINWEQEKVTITRGTWNRAPTQTNINSSITSSLPLGLKTQSDSGYQMFWRVFAKLFPRQYCKNTPTMNHSDHKQAGVFVAYFFKSTLHLPRFFSDFFYRSVPAYPVVSTFVLRDTCWFFFF